MKSTFNCLKRRLSQIAETLWPNRVEQATVLSPLSLFVPHKLRLRQASRLFMFRRNTFLRSSLVQFVPHWTRSSTPERVPVRGTPSPEPPVPAPASLEVRRSWRTLGGWLPPSPAKALRATSLSTFGVLFACRAVVIRPPKALRGQQAGPLRSFGARITTAWSEAPPGLRPGLPSANDWRLGISREPQKGARSC